MNWKALKQKSLDLWHSLPPEVQATVVVGTSTTSTLLGEKMSQYFLDPSTACWKWHCLRHTIAAAVAAGFIAGRAFYMRPGPGPKSAAPTSLPQ